MSRLELADDQAHAMSSTWFGEALPRVFGPFREGDLKDPGRRHHHDDGDERGDQSVLDHVLAVLPP